jgi:hypothetical protein
MSRSFPSSGENSACPGYNFGGKMNDKNMEQRIIVKACVNMGKNAGETLAY